MGWEKRALGLVLAGGTIAMGACSSSSSSTPCGNANPDPCICGRPESSPALAEMCRVKTACDATGGTYSPDTVLPDGGVSQEPSCIPDGGASDAARDGAPE